MFQNQANVRSMPRGAANNGNNQNSNRPDAYLNFYLPKRGGTRAKLGAFKMYLDNKNDAQVINHLTSVEDMEAAIEQLKGRIQIEFNVVSDEVTEDDELMLG